MVVKQVLIPYFDLKWLDKDVKICKMDSIEARNYISVNGDWCISICKEEIDKNLYDSLQMPPMLHVLLNDDMITKLEKALVVGMNKLGKFAPIDPESYSYDTACKPDEFLFRLYDFTWCIDFYKRPDIKSGLFLFFWFRFEFINNTSHNCSTYNNICHIFRKKFFNFTSMFSWSIQTYFYNSTR